MNKVTPEQLLAEVDDVLRSMPTAYASLLGIPKYTLGPDEPRLLHMSGML